MEILKKLLLSNKYFYLADVTGLALILAHRKKPLLSENGLRIASIEDISAMKVISIIQRGLKKDFIDL